MWRLYRTALPAPVRSAAPVYQAHPAGRARHESWPPQVRHHRNEARSGVFHGLAWFPLRRLCRRIVVIAPAVDAVGIEQMHEDAVIAVERRGRRHLEPIGHVDGAAEGRRRLVQRQRNRRQRRGIILRPTPGNKPGRRTRRNKRSPTSLPRLKYHRRIVLYCPYAVQYASLAPTLAPL